MPTKIDREALVRRHCPTAQTLDPMSAFSVGNGEFAFTADITGLQTFPEAYREKFPICTTAHWAWHSATMPAGLDPKAFRYTPYNAHGRMVGYATGKTGQEALFEYLRKNPHRLHLGQIGFDLRKADGTRAKPEDLNDIRQTYDLWSGHLISRFTLESIPVSVLTLCHPEHDLLAVRVESPLIATGRLGIRIAFPGGSPSMDMADWEHPNQHTTTLKPHGTRAADIERTLDNDRYGAALSWSDGGTLKQAGPHTLELSGSGGALELSMLFQPRFFTGGDLPCQ